ncbi:hypothetical protein SAMN05421788_106213 [Filimonas lacunae]|uniref:Uncharacterized protein n=1 Tax=Filimonas lacunae TaxID=477680 RepID=A0A173MFD8_9BACT|nr:hypothetical protein [Filimonas lacunae]BAV06151.1 hypothetical protein FLA_2167 [Filimonas lacunae]SIT24933.1 hypothetical protein SAMN05421788_106213 [Filimonas lacunae]
MPDVRLNLINRSEHTGKVQVVIGQFNKTLPERQAVIAWRVFNTQLPGENFAFSYPMEKFISVSDSWGNYSPQKNAYPGQLFSVENDIDGDILKYSAQAASPYAIEVVNRLEFGAIDANIYTDGRLLFVQKGVSPGKKVVFQFEPSIWIGVLSEVEEGRVIDAAMLAGNYTDLSLLDIEITETTIRSADIIMTGGGSSTTATSFQFHLENVIPY